MSLTQEERNVLVCLFDGNYWTVDEIADTIDGNRERIAAFLKRLLADGWIERFPDTEQPAMYRRTHDAEVSA